MKRHVLLVWFLVLLFVFNAACDHHRGTRVHNTCFYANADVPRTDLFMIGRYCCPGMNRDHGHPVIIKRDKKDREIIQKDIYGRECCTLHFSLDWSQWGIPGGEGIYDVMVVLQACNDGMIYFYEDYCFRLIPPSGLTEAEKVDFLQRNDWDKPFQESKCSARENDVERTIYSKTDSFYDTEDKFFPNAIDCETLIQDKLGKELRWVTEYDEATGERRAWLVIWPPSIKDFEYRRDVMTVDTLDFGPALHEFKIAHGWVFE